MSLRERIGDAISGRKQKNEIRQKESYQIHVSSLCSAYENLFAQVRPLINDMKAVIPYGVGRNGARLPISKTQALAKLMDPNTTMGWGEFADAMFATWLTEDELNIRVHKNKRGYVEGYTILPVGSRRVRNGYYYWNIEGLDGRIVEIGEDEVMTLRFSRNPRNLDKGVSPASASFIWSQIDDLVSQYQKAFFENGAVPATITFIKARTRDSYEKKRVELEHGLSGAKNRNKTVYVWRQLLDDGSEGDELEVKTIQGTNATLAIKDIIEIVNDKLNKAVGVSNFILGDDSSAKYDNAELSDYQFIKRRVHPALMSFWSQFQHELDRITGGLNYAIQFDLELPELTERLKVKAETKKIQLETLRDAIYEGSLPSAAVKALDLPKKWLEVADGFYAEKLRDDEREERELVQYQIQVSQGESKAVSAQEAEVIEDKAESGSERKIEALDGEIYTPVFKEGEEIEKQVYEMLVDYAEQIVAENPNIDEAELVDRLTEMFMKEADKGSVQGAEAVQGLLKGEPVAEEIAKMFADDGYKLSEGFRKGLFERTGKLVSNYGGVAKENMAGVLQKAAEESWSASEIKKELSKSIPRDRAELIARNETVYAVKSGRIETDKYIEDNYGVKIGLVWKISDNGACDVCKAMDGTVVKCGEAFPDHAEYEGVEHYWEHSSWNDGGECPNAHVNCRCYFDEEIIG